MASLDDLLQETSGGSAPSNGVSLDDLLTESPEMAATPPQRRRAVVAPRSSISASDQLMMDLLQTPLPPEYYALSGRPPSEQEVSMTPWEQWSQLAHLFTGAALPSTIGMSVAGPLRILVNALRSRPGEPAAEVAPAVESVLTTPATVARHPTMEAADAFQRNMLEAQRLSQEQALLRQAGLPQPPTAVLQRPLEAAERGVRFPPRRPPIQSVGAPPTPPSEPMIEGPMQQPVSALPGVPLTPQADTMKRVVGRIVSVRSEELPTTARTPPQQVRIARIQQPDGTEQDLFIHDNRPLPVGEQGAFQSYKDQFNNTHVGIPKEAFAAEQAARVAPRPRELSTPAVEGHSDLVKVNPPTVVQGTVEMRAPSVDGKAIFDPNAIALEIPPDRTYLEQLGRAWEKAKAKLPQELPAMRIRPETPVITEVERHAVRLKEALQTFTDHPTFQVFRKYEPHDLMSYETQAVRAWIAGGKTSEAYETAIRSLPPDVQALMRYRQQRFVIEQDARQYLGLERLPEEPGPYFPRMTEKDWLETVRLSRGGFRGIEAELQQTVAKFQKARVHDTYLDGLKHEVEYIDPRNAWVLREWEGIKLEETANLVKSLEGKALFRSRAEAAAVSPTRSAVELEGLPGSATQRWWAPTKPEAEFLRHNLGERARGSLSSMIGWMHQLFRNPNLFNPLPHFTKNMLYKYGLSRGGPNVGRDMTEYFRQSNPELLARFRQAMPFTRDAQSVHEVLQDALVHGPVATVARGVGKVVGMINRPSSKAIFAYLDPGLRYARWKQYVSQGLSDQEAANHAWVDLVRYGTRSDLVDFWKSWPVNFFVPWRVGTVTSVYKQLTDHPFRAALFIGAVDYLREARYRSSGRWTHLPIDYVQAPVLQIVENREHAAKFAGSLVGLIGTTALFGPGGAMTGTQISNLILDVVQGRALEKGEYQRLLNMFWGLSQAYNMPQEFAAFRRDGDAKHLINLMTSAALAEHSALNYEPRRMMKWLPEWMPMMEKSEFVREAEQMQAARRARGERLQERRSRPRPKIEEILVPNP